MQRDTDSDRDILYTECQCLVIINKSSSICKAADLLVLFVGSGLTRILSSIYRAHYSYPAADGGRDLDALLLHLLLLLGLIVLFRLLSDDEDRKSCNIHKLLSASTGSEADLRWKNVDWDEPQRICKGSLFFVKCRRLFPHLLLYGP